MIEISYTTTSPGTSSLSAEYKEYDFYTNFFNACDDVLEIIFFSNCMDMATKMKNNQNCVFSNIFKFYYCLQFNKLDTYFSPDDNKNILNVQIQSALLHLQLNFNTNPNKMLNPLSLLSSEKNNAALMQCVGETYVTGSPRDNALLGEGTSLGGINSADLRISLV